MPTVTPTRPDPTPRTGARVAGLGYLALFPLALFANFFVRQGLVDADDPSATVANLVADEQLFRFGVAAFVVVFLVDVAIAWGLHVLLRPAGSARSLLAAWFRLAYTVLLGVAATSLLIALRIATDEALFAEGADAARAGWTALAVEAFDHMWMVGLAAFGVHLVLTGRLVAAAAGARVLGVLLVVAGAAYVFDTAAYTLLTDYADHEDLFLAVVATPSIVAELWFTIWLLRHDPVTGRGGASHPGLGHGGPGEDRTMPRGDDPQDTTADEVVSGIADLVAPDADAEHPAGPDRAGDSDPRRIQDGTGRRLSDDDPT